MAGSAFFTAASGLRNHQLRIDVIANNIANVNTTGYKAASVIFGDVLNQTLRGASAPTSQFGGINPKQVGLGMQLAAIHNLMQQSALENTARQTDFAVNGAGFFITTDGKQDFYTRAGDFNLDRDGRLIAGDGMRVQGYNKLNADGTAVDPGKGIGDILIEFGKKLNARASSWLEFASNMDAASFRYGSANNETANVGTTGILTFAGAAEPWTVVAGTALTAVSPVPPPNNDITINGVTVSYDSSAAVDLQEAANIVAEAINADPVMNRQVQATVRESSGNYQVVLQAVLPGTSLDIQAITDFASCGLTVGLYEPQPEPGPFLVGDSIATVTDAKAAVATTTVPVGIGTNAPVTGDQFIINGITVILTSVYDPLNTAAQNAVLVANDINDTLNITVTATANSNGTLTIHHNFAGKQRQPLGAIVGQEDMDILIEVDDTTYPNLASQLGIDSLSSWTTAVGNDYGGIDNGINAKAELVFTPDDGTPPLVRFFEDWAYDRSIPPLALPAFTYSESSLVAVQGAIQGASATFPLLPGVNISIDELNAGQASFRTEDAYQHTTSRIVYDSLGNAHNLTTTFTHVNENIWDFEVSLPEEPNILMTNTTGRLTFSQDGLITSGNPASPVSFTAPGASTTEVDLIFDGRGRALDGITQYASATTTSAREQDGYTMGVLTDFEADSSGTIVAFFDNGQRRPIAQIALATFSNPEGLNRVGATSFRETSNSGSAVSLQPGTGGSGVIFNGYIEQSNVDIALEFTGLIITQRGLQANSRVFTTQDEILNEIVNLKR